MKGLLATVAAAVVSIGVSAATTDKNYTPAALDLAVPESPAAALLSGEFETVLKPSTPREFTSSLLALKDKKGGLAPGISIEVTPSFFTSRDALPADYRKNHFKRMALNTQLSIATGEKDATTGKVTQLAAGIRVPIYDEGDPRFDPDRLFGGCAARLIEPPKLTPPEPGKSPTPGESAKPLSDEEIGNIEVCKTQYRFATWNAQALVFGAAQLWSDSSESDSKLKSGGRSFWLSYALPLGGKVLVDKKVIPVPWKGKDAKETIAIETRPAQLILQARRLDKAMREGSEPESQRRYDSNAGAMRLRYGSEGFNVSLAASAERRRYDDGNSENVRIVSGGAETRITPDWWLRFTLGNERRGSTSDEPFVAFNLSWSRESAPVYGPLPSAK
jgi:hypothetical protein